MTTSIKQTWAAIVPDRAKVDAARQHGKNGETGFADAVKSVKPGKRDTQVGHEAGHKPPLRLHVALPDRVAGELVAAHPRQDVAGGRDVDDPEVSMNETSEEPASPEERATVASAAPPAFRPLLPPMILLGGLGRHEAGSSSEDGISKTAGPASSPVDTAPAEPGKTSAMPIKPAVDATPVLSAAAMGTPAQGNAKTATGETAPLAQSQVSQAASTVGKHGEPKPTQILVDPAVKPAAADPGADAAAKSAAGGAAARPDSISRGAAMSPDSQAEGAADATGPSGRVTIIAQQNIPAPATPAPGLTAAPLLAAVAADGSWREVATAADLRDLPAQNAVASTRSLKVQLRPAELGMVTASLRFSGEQLTIELHVESVEAQQRLSADSDTIVKSLRALGLEVDRVTIQQSTVVQTSNGRADANAGQNGQPAPDRQSFNAGSSGGGNGQGGGQQAGRSTSNGAHVSQNSASPGLDRAGGSLYI